MPPARARTWSLRLPTALAVVVAAPAAAGEGAMPCADLHLPVGTPRVEAGTPIARETAAGESLLGCPWFEVGVADGDHLLDPIELGAVVRHQIAPVLAALPGGAAAQEVRIDAYVTDVPDDELALLVAETRIRQADLALRAFVQDVRTEPGTHRTKTVPGRPAGVVLFVVPLADRDLRPEPPREEVAARLAPRIGSWWAHERPWLAAGVEVSVVPAAAWPLELDASLAGGVTHAPVYTSRWEGQSAVVEVTAGARLVPRGGRSGPFLGAGAFGRPEIGAGPRAELGWRVDLTALQLALSLGGAAYVRDVALSFGGIELAVAARLPMRALEAR